MAVVQVLLASMVILLVKYDPAGRNCLALPLLFLSVSENTCSIVLLLPALITGRNVCMHSCKCAFLHASLFSVFLVSSRFLQLFNLWLNLCMWALFVFLPHTFQPAATLP